MSLRERRDGEHLGPKRTISARKIAETLGLKDAPPPEPPMPDTPAAARLRVEGRAKAADLLMEAAKENFMMRTVPAGRDAMDALGVRPEDLPVGAEAGMGPPEPKREDGWLDGSYDDTVKPKPEAPSPSPGDAAELAREFRVHAKRISELAKSAKASGDPAREARAAEEVAASREVGEALQARGVL